MTSENNKILIRDGDLTCPLHLNSELEVVTVERGTLRVHIEGVTHMLSSNDAILILPYRLHSFEPSEDAVARVYMFPFSLSGELYETHKCNSFTTEPFKPCAAAFSYVENALPYYTESKDNSTMRSIFFVFISEFLKINKPLTSDYAPPGTARRITEYLYDNLTEALSPLSTADALGITIRALNEALNKYTGMTFAVFLRNLRIGKAMALLSKGDLNVTETAYACGFGSLRSFNRAFLAAMGCTPSEYRRRGG